MPGYVIHLAVAEEYLRKQKKVKENYNDFIEGVIYPDSVTDKSLTHYGQKSSLANLYNFLKENDLKDSFKRGYFLHLLTDYLFYNKYLDRCSKDIYNDYDILNRELIEKYEVKLPEKIKKYVFFKDNLDGLQLKILTYVLACKLIDDISNMQLDDIAKDVLENPEKWTKFKTLKE